MRLELCSRGIRRIPGTESLPVGRPLGLKLLCNFEGRDEDEGKVRSRIVLRYVDNAS